MHTTSTQDCGPVLIVGAGLAGLFAALKLGATPVTILTVSPLGAGAASAWAQGGIAAAIGEDDSVALHVADTLAAGAGLVDPAVARDFCADAAARIEDLVDLGVPFDRDAKGRLALGREAAHSRNRIVRVKGDSAGAAIIEALANEARHRANITVIEGWKAVELIRSTDGGISGVWAFNRDGQVRAFTASQTVLALGGAGGLYEVTTNPVSARGAAMAMASRAGAEIRDAEFVQFHPTAIDIGRDPAPLATEALRGEGATLHDANGRRFMPEQHKDAELAPRDVVARGVFRARRETGRVFLDATKAVGAAFPERFPTVFKACMSAGLDPRAELIPVTTAAHYHMGGVVVRADGACPTLPGLWLAGECAWTGFHGANRLASNSLLEAVVLGGRVASGMLNITASGAADLAAPISGVSRLHSDGIARLRALMTAHVNVERDAAGLETALAGLDAIAREGDRADWELKNAVTAARLIAEGAKARTESRGGHFRIDYPFTDDALTLKDAA